MDEQRRRGPYAKGMQRRKEIVDRTLDVFARKGYTKLSLRAIAGEINISHAAILHYFPSLEDLLIEVIAVRDQATLSIAQEQRDAGMMAELIAGARSNVTVPGLIALHTSLLGTAIEPGPSSSREFFAERFERGREALAEAIVRGRREGTVPEGPDARALASLTLAALDGLQIQWLLDPAQDLVGNLSVLKALVGDAPGWVFGDQPTAAPGDAPSVLGSTADSESLTESQRRVV